MEKTLVSNLDEFLKLISQEKYQGNRTFFRGVRNACEHKLTPSVGRTTQNASNGEYEKNLLKYFKLQARGLLQSLPKTDMEWMALAQHHGVPTRLLDWTSDILVALYFATQPFLDNKGAIREPEADFAAVYAFKCYSVATLDEDPFKDRRIPAIVFPPAVTPRITQQGGVFSIQDDPTKELQNSVDGVIGNLNGASWIEKFIFGRNFIKDAQKRLFYLGIRHERLFPDLDGLAQGIKIRQEILQSYFEEPNPGA